jgi:hypothetical protein
MRFVPRTSSTPLLRSAPRIIFRNPVSFARHRIHTAFPPEFDRDALNEASDPCLMRDSPGKDYVERAKYGAGRERPHRGMLPVIARPSSNR